MEKGKDKNISSLGPSNEKEGGGREGGGGNGEEKGKGKHFFDFKALPISFSVCSPP